MKTKNQLEKEWISMNQDLRIEKFNHKLTKVCMVGFFILCLLGAYLLTTQQEKIEDYNPSLCNPVNIHYKDNIGMNYCVDCQIDGCKEFKQIIKRNNNSLIIYNNKTIPEGEFINNPNLLQYGENQWIIKDFIGCISDSNNPNERCFIKGKEVTREELNNYALSMEDVKK